MRFLNGHNARAGQGAHEINVVAGFLYDVATPRRCPVSSGLREYPLFGLQLP